MSCEHFDVEEISKISIMNKMVYKDECTLCFYQAEDENGINICLSCFNGSCQNNQDMNIFDHTQLHSEKTQHQIYLHVKKFVEREEQSEQDIDKIAINKQGGFLDVEVITYEYKIYCEKCKNYKEVPEKLKQLVQSIEQQDSAYKKNTLESWELENTACQHAKQYPKQDTQKLNSLGNKCSDCDMSSNLWLCADCGNLGCGRKYHDGTGGNNHGISHYEQTGHKVSIKLGTIAANAKASCYCYTCNDETSIFEIDKTLSKLGLNLKDFIKTEKTINELSLELNLNFKLSNKFEKTEHLKKLPMEENYNGLDNIGNSCYINSLVQNLAVLEETKNFCIHNSEKSLNHIKNCKELPYNCNLCQFIKLMSSLRDSQYLNKFKSIKPYLFRYLFGKDHLEFRTQRQQDACEYMVHLFTFIQKFQDQLDVEYLQKMLGQSVTKYTCDACKSYFIQNNYGKAFTLKLNDQLKQKIIAECEGKENFIYNLKFEDMVNGGLVADDTVSDCPKCNKKCVFQGKTYFKQYPKYLILHTERFTYYKNKAIKLQYDLQFDNKQKIDMEILDIQKLQINQELEIKKSEQSDFNKESINNLMAMGFSEQRCKRALKESGNNMETALNLLLSNVDNPQWDQSSETKSNLPQFFDQVWEIAGAMGVDKNYGEKVCKVFGDKNAEFCINYLLENPFDNGSLVEPQEPVQQEAENENTEVQDDGNRNYKLLGGVVHLGKSPHVGHYVAFTERNEKWIYFNDDKVYEAEKPKIGMSYILFLQKNQFKQFKCINCFLFINCYNNFNKMLIQLLIRYIRNGGRISRQLPIDSETSVSDLQQLIFTNFGIPEKEQIIRFIQSNYEVRVIPGFSLEFYEIRNNSIIEIQRINQKKDLEKKQDNVLEIVDQNYKNDIYEQRLQIINRLTNQTTQLQHLSTIKEEEEEQEETEDDKVFKQAKEKFLEITRENKTKNQEVFFAIFENLTNESQLNLLEALDNVGWSGIHYAILFNNKQLIKKILEIYGNDTLSIVSRDGWSPLFLCLQQKNWSLFRIMLPYATTEQCEIQTQKGSLLHEAFREAPFDIIKDMILNQKVNPQKKDFEDIVALDIVRDNIKEKIKYLYKITEIPEKPYSICGIVEKNSIFFSWMKRFLRLNVENRVLERYRKNIHIPFKPCEVMPLKNIVDFRIEDNNDHLEPNKVFIKFSYNKEEHVYRASYKDGKIWQILMEKATKWVNYYNKFPGNKANTQYVDKIKELWNEVDKNYEEFELFNEQQLDELLKKDIFPQQEQSIKPKLEDFFVIQLLGRGAFARVYKVVHKHTRKVFAMKVLKKENLIKYQQEKYSKIEKEILRENQNNPFLLSLHFAFQDMLSLFMVVDYCPNGDLSILLARQPNNRFSEFQVKIYIAQIVLALEDLHKRNYIYRDLKPENILIDQKGYLKLADFGLAANDIKTQSDFAKSFCGSPIYLSPELLKNKKTYKVSDFYTLGVVMYELLSGEPPFYTDDLNRLYNNIKKGQLQFPPDLQVSLQCKDIIQRLMRNNPKTRLGANNGTEDIKLHKFFADIDWQALKNKEIPPPIQFQQIKEIMPKKTQ